MFHKISSAVVLAVLFACSLAQADSLSGRVIDEQNKPVSGVKVHAALSTNDKVWNQAMTSENGNFTMADLPIGHYRLILSKPGNFFAHQVEAEVKAGQTGIVPDIIALRGVIVSGRVIDADTGKPVAGVFLDVDLLENNPHKWYKTDKNGKYELRAIPGVSKHIYYCRSNSLYMAMDQKDLPINVTGPLSNVEFKIKKGNIISGTVQDESGKPIMNAIVIATSGDPAYSDAQGHFKTAVRSMPDRNPVIFTTLTVLQDAQQVGLFESFGTKISLKSPVILTVRPLQRLKVTVNGPDGKPLKNALVAPIALAEEGEFVGSPSHAFASPQKTNATDKDGICTFKHLIWGGRYKLEVELKGYYWAGRIAPLRVDETLEDNIKVVMQPTNRTQRGRFVDENGKPIAGARVHASFGFMCSPDWEPSTMTDANGEFVLTEMPDSEIRVDARKNAYGAFAVASKDTEFLEMKAIPITEKN
ncbi:MAG: carboxypeptidase regulatory-like domain-containing protein [Armatimonadetes bacterium]|nr:carboxypeptidase regulatory-like domain-containing protein [Armatimonadota bacterium]